MGESKESFSFASVFFFGYHLSEVGAIWNKGGLKRSKELKVGNSLIVYNQYDNKECFYYIVEPDQSIYWGKKDELKEEPEFMELINEIHQLVPRLPYDDLNR